MRESFALDQLAALLLTERVLLAVGGIPHPVHEQVYDGESCQCRATPAVFGRLVVREVECAVAVGEWHTSHVPESQDEAQLLEVHVPTQEKLIIS